MPSLFEAAGMEASAPRPLADRLRPQALSEVAGQAHLLAPGAPLARMVESGALRSVIFWGAPGTGKTTVARLLAELPGYEFEQLSAITSGVQALRETFERARRRRGDGLATVLFVDEIHRFNRAQQDAFLPVMEDGTIILVGATTENPSFELNGALLSRATVLRFHRLDEAALETLLERAESAQDGRFPLTSEARAQLINMADGDGRALINLFEDVMAAHDPAAGDLDIPALADLVQRRAPLYDKSRDAHYDLISALHKSVRGSDPDAALYWLARMLTGGEDPLYIARRLVRMAVEDIALADPHALTLAIAARDAYDFLGSPEGELALAQVAVHLAMAPKSNAVYTAYKTAMASARDTGSLPPPRHILNAPTQLMKDEGYGEGYAYDHDAPGGVSGQSYFPEGMARQTYYEPSGRGAEADLAERLERFRALRARKSD
jgi:putative ATPase